MDGIETWISLGVLLVGVITLWLDHIRDKKKINTLVEMVVLYKKEINLLQRSLPAQLAFQQEWLNLQKQIHEAEEKREWAKLIGGALKYIAENSD